jgi:hypothetical protein
MQSDADTSSVDDATNTQQPPSPGHAPGVPTESLTRSFTYTQRRGGPTQHGPHRTPPITDSDGYTLARTRTTSAAQNPPTPSTGNKHVSFSAPLPGSIGVPAADAHLSKRVSPINSNTPPTSDPKPPQPTSDTSTHSSTPKIHPVPPAYNPADFKQLSIIFALRPANPDSHLEIYTDTFLPAFFQTLMDYVVELAPHNIFANSWTLGLKYGIGPFPITPDQKDFLIQSIYVIVFKWPSSSAINEQEVANIFKTLSSSEITEVTLPVRTGRKKALASTIKDDNILFNICFSTTIQELSSFAKKGKSLLSYQFTISLPDNCPDERISFVLCFIAEFLLDRKVDPSQDSINSLYSRQESPFDKVKHLHPRYLNNFRLLLDFDRQESAEYIALFHRACTAHKDHRSKKLLPADTHDCKIKNASFGYISEQRGKSNTRNPIPWMLREYDMFMSLNPLISETTSASASSDASRDPRNPWNKVKLPPPLLADRPSSTRTRALNKPPVDADNDSEDLDDAHTGNAHKDNAEMIDDSRLSDDPPPPPPC